MRTKLASSPSSHATEPLDLVEKLKYIILLSAVLLPVFKRLLYVLPIYKLYIIRDIPENHNHGRRDIRF